MNAGKLGINAFADTGLWRKLDKLAGPWAKGTVDTQFALPNSTDAGWDVRTTALHENFNKGLNPKVFALLKQKGSLLENVDIITDTVRNVTKNVVRLRANAVKGGAVTSAALLQTKDLFGSGRYEIVARSVETLRLTLTRTLPQP